jgi:hypothetical protein
MLQSYNVIHIEMPTDMTNILQVKTRSIWTIYVVICDSYPFFFKQYLFYKTINDTYNTIVINLDSR